ncbi:MAG TPA: polysaccharide deacetylase family protein [Firmicutes bacterium]|nr:polysaccharide deacetylase family protein [Candidatus Fermentithermobacillaceae bacterium]
MNSPQPNHRPGTVSKRRRRSGNRKTRARNLRLVAACAIGIAILFFMRPLRGPGVFGTGKSQGLGEVPVQAPEPGPPVVEPENKPVSALGETRARKVSELAERPNELGKVPVIMYHVIGESESDWVRTAANFRRDLERYYELGYSLVPLQSYLTGEIDLPAGVSPLVITFDDATAGQFRLIAKKYVEDNGARKSLEHNVPDPDSAVGILLEFSKAHPGFGHAATFFVDFPAPFEVPGEVREKLNYLLDCGMEIGNHTYNHRNLRDCSADVIQMELGKQSGEIEQLTGRRPLSLALPYGGYPKDSSNKKHLMAGEYQGTAYENRAVLLVGAEPALSPYHESLNKAAIPRIRGSEEELSKWLEYLDSSGTRYVSDGKAGTITVSEREQDSIAGAFRDTYEIVLLPD